MPFERLGRLATLSSPPEFRFDELRTAVSAHVSYTQLPLAVGSHSIRLSEDRALLSIHPSARP